MNRDTRVGTDTVERRDGYGKRPIKFHSPKSPDDAADKYAARSRPLPPGCREKGTTIYRGLSLIDPVFGSSLSLSLSLSLSPCLVLR